MHRRTLPPAAALMPFRGLVLKRSPLVSPAIKAHIQAGFYEKHEIEYALTHMHYEDVVLELGSGIGALSAVLLTHYISPARYIALEANASLVALARENHRLNNIGRCEFVCGVATHERGREDYDFYISRNFWASSLSPMPDCVAVVRVKALRFNDLVRMYRPTFLICDIEGGEYSLLTHEADLAPIRKLCLEVHNADAAKLAGLFDTLQAKGFCLKAGKRASTGVVFFEKDLPATPT